MLIQLWKSKILRLQGGGGGLLLHKWRMSEIESWTQTIAIIIDILLKSNYEFHKFSSSDSSSQVKKRSHLIPSQSSPGVAVWVLWRSGGGLRWGGGLQRWQTVEAECAWSFCYREKTLQERWVKNNDCGWSESRSSHLKEAASPHSVLYQGFIKLN